MNSHDPLDLEGQEAQLVATAEQRQRAMEIEKADIAWLMDDKRGRRFIRGLLERAGVFRSSFSESALSTAFAEGRRNEGLRLLERVMANGHDKYALMLSEGSEK